MNYFEILKDENIRKDFIDYINNKTLPEYFPHKKIGHSFTINDYCMKFNFIAKNIFLFVDVKDNEVHIMCTGKCFNVNIKKDIERYLKYISRKVIIDSI